MGGGGGKGRARRKRVRTATMMAAAAAAAASEGPSNEVLMEEKEKDIHSLLRQKELELAKENIATEPSDNGTLIALSTNPRACVLLPFVVASAALALSRTANLFICQSRG